jgi:uncharacterized membrane protein YdjX (TVP38/TMEM64 family)
MRRALTVAALAGLALLIWRVWDHDAVLAWMRQASPVPYFTAMALLTVIGVPVTPLFVVAGATFGAPVGLVGSGLALAASLAMSYRIARGRLRPWLESLLRRFGSELPDFGEAGRNALRFTLMVKLTPGLPAFVKNYGLAAAGVPFPTYLGVSMLVTGAYAAALVLFGESLFEHDFGPTLVVAAVVALVGGLGALWVRRRRGRVARRAGRPGPGEGRPRTV